MGNKTDDSYLNFRSFMTESTTTCCSVKLQRKYIVFNCKKLWTTSTVNSAIPVTLTESKSLPH
jgi:hypothetical protein